MSDDNIREAFFEVCDKAQERVDICVSMYVDVPFYGGPEEGGWWGRDTVLVAYQVFSSHAKAHEALARLKALVAEKNKEATREWGQRCQREMAWCDARGLDYDYLPETGGDCSYWTCVEDSPGQHESRGSRHYE